MAVPLPSSQCLWVMDIVQGLHVSTCPFLYEAIFTEMFLCVFPMGLSKDGSFHEALQSLFLGQGWLNGRKMDEEETGRPGIPPKSLISFFLAFWGQRWAILRL